MNSRFMRLLAAPAGLAVTLASGTILSSGMTASATLRPAGPAGTWRTAKELPGLGALNKGGNSAPLALSCGSPGNCAVGGYYRDSANRRQAFVSDERKGVWRTAEPVAGIGALNKDGFAQVTALSCPSAGNCAAGGLYEEASGHFQVFVVTEKNGKWGKGITAPGTKTLNKGGNASITSLSCAKAGDCSAVGTYRDAASHGQAFLLTEHNGTWQTAAQVAGLATLNQGNFAGLDSVSCGAPGDCAAGGFYTDSSASSHGFVVNETSDKWGAAQAVPGLDALNVGGFAKVTVVSCGSASNCSAGGYYHTGPTQVQAFVVNRPSGKWGFAEPVPGVIALNADDDAFVGTLSCAKPGDCGAAGSYSDGTGQSWPFVVSEKNAQWGTAVIAPGVQKLSGAGQFGGINSFSCASPGNCAGAGQYTDATDHTQAFVIVQHNGTWNAATVVPGLAALNKDHSAATAVVSCRAPAACTAAGWYFDAHGRQETFVN